MNNVYTDDIRGVSQYVNGVWVDIIKIIKEVDSRITGISFHEYDGFFVSIHYKDNSTKLKYDLVTYNSVDDMIKGVIRREILNRKFN